MGVLDFIFPKTCVECGAEGNYICRKCLDKVRLLQSACPYCEKPSIDGFTHTKCARVYGLDGLTSIWKYEGVIKKAVLALKFRYSTEVGKELAQRFIAGITTNPMLFPGQVLVPIPIYWLRQNVRGFNQSEEIGRMLVQKMGWSFKQNLLIKSKPTASQVELTVEGRTQNLRGAFRVNPDVGVSNNIVLFDDVFTTGSTLKEAAKVLKRAGVKRVWGLTIAR